jgi:hypothetical protein
MTKYQALLLMGCLLVTPWLHSSETEPLFSADDARIAAMLNADRVGLEKLLSDDLHYAHSNGKLDSKSSFIDALAAKTTRYQVYALEERKATFPVDGMAILSGRARVEVASAMGEMKATLSYLAVWRREGGQWKLLAWQSCRLLSPEAKP